MSESEIIDVIQSNNIAHVKRVNFALTFEGVASTLTFSADWHGLSAQDSTPKWPGMVVFGPSAFDGRLSEANVDSGRSSTRAWSTR